MSLRYPSETTKNSSYEKRAVHCATIGSEGAVAAAGATTSSTSVPVVESAIMGHRTVLEQRRSKALTPYLPDAWEELLQETGLFEKYAHIPNGFRFGFKLGFPTITSTKTPPNSQAIVQFSSEFRKIVDAEIKKQRYIGPMSRIEVESCIGPFQTSPFSIIPKPGRPGQYRIIQNYSHPHDTITTAAPYPSINSFIDSDNFPCTWGTFTLVSLLIRRLPPGSQAGTRDVSEAYRGIPLHPSQWPGAVAQTGDQEFCIDTCVSFGVASSAGAFGVVADSAAEILRAKGIGPVTKWVDDFPFFRSLREYLQQFNKRRGDWHAEINEYGGQHQDGGRIWYGGARFDDGTLNEFDEDCRYPLADFSQDSDRSEEDRKFTYNFDDVDRISDRLGIPWEKSKEQQFGYIFIYIGLVWNLATLAVSLEDKKRDKYLQAIRDWQSTKTHVLKEVQGLYGKLRHATLVVPRGRAYLSGLESMLGSGTNSPFVPHTPPRETHVELQWWTTILSEPASTSRSIPEPVTLIDCGAFSDASSGFGIAVVIDGRWRAWRLIPDWQTLNGKKDIAWAEAIGFEFLVRILLKLPGASGKSFKIFGDNKGVVEGWWNRRSRNTEVNRVFRRLLEFLHAEHAHTKIHTAYVKSAENPADAPSRGRYGHHSLLLPPIIIPEGLDGFIMDATEPYSERELSLRRKGSCYPQTIPKEYDTARFSAESAEHECEPGFYEGNSCSHLGI